MLRLLLVPLLFGLCHCQLPPCCRCQPTKADSNGPYGPKCTTHNTDSTGVSSFCPALPFNPEEDWPPGKWILYDQGGVKPHIRSDDGKFVCDAMTLIPCAGAINGDPCGTGKTCQMKPPSTQLQCLTKPPPPAPCANKDAGAACTMQPGNKPGKCTNLATTAAAPQMLKCISGPCAGLNPGSACTGPTNMVANQCKLSPPTNPTTMVCSGIVSPCAGKPKGGACKTGATPGTCQPQAGKTYMVCVPSPCVGIPRGGACRAPAKGKCTLVNRALKCTNGPCAGLAVNLPCKAAGNKPGKCIHGGGGLVCRPNPPTGCAVHRNPGACNGPPYKCMWAGAKKCVTRKGCPNSVASGFTKANSKSTGSRISFPSGTSVRFQGGKKKSKYTGIYTSPRYPVKNQQVKLSLTVKGGGSLDGGGKYHDYTDLTLIVDGKTDQNIHCEGWNCPKQRIIKMTSKSKAKSWFQIVIKTKLTGGDEWYEYGNLVYAVCAP